MRFLRCLILALFCLHVGAKDIEKIKPKQCKIKAKIRKQPEPFTCPKGYTCEVRDGDGGKVIFMERVGN